MIWKVFLKAVASLRPWVTVSKSHISYSLTLYSSQSSYTVNASYASLAPVIPILYISSISSLKFPAPYYYKIIIFIINIMIDIVLLVFSPSCHWFSQLFIICFKTILYHIHLNGDTFVIKDDMNLDLYNVIHRKSAEKKKMDGNGNYKYTHGFCFYGFNFLATYIGFSIKVLSGFFR